MIQLILLCFVKKMNLFRETCQKLVATIIIITEKRFVRVYIYIYIYILNMYIYIYIYTYIYILRPRLILVTVSTIADIET